MYLEIITPDEKVFEGEVISVIFPGSDGSFQVLNNHAPLVSTLKKGLVTYADEKQKHKVTIEGGVVEVLNNRVMVLADNIISEEEEK